jgi:hypothetical protein
MAKTNHEKHVIKYANKVIKTVIKDLKALPIALGMKDNAESLIIISEGQKA